MAPRRRRATLRPVLALLALFSGTALLLNIIANIDLRLGLGGTTLIMVGAVAVLLRGASPEGRRSVVRAAAIGAVTGLIGTLAYDVSKAALSLLDPSPFDPFHAIHVFGEHLVGATAPEFQIVTAGLAFHLLNGTSFAIAYTFLFAHEGATSLRRALATGIGWGLFLESFQITLYPGWLDIRAYREFALISGLGHVVYGATLGTVARTLLRATNRLTHKGVDTDG